MTVSYTAQVASCQKFGCFWKLLFRWKGSIYKLLWPNLFIYMSLYGILSTVYRFGLNGHQQHMFEQVSLYCQTYGNLIPVSFVLGFYVTIVIKRWWDQYSTIPWPDSLALFVSAFIPGQDDRSRLMRRTIMRYSNLSSVLTLRMVCPSVKKRFPTYAHLIEAGFMLPGERKIFEAMDAKSAHPKYWMPLVWAATIVTKCRKEGIIQDDFGLKTLIDEINKIRGLCGGLLNYDWISVPLVVTLAVYTYFVSTLMGSQFLNPERGYPGHQADLVVPIFSLLQYIFYMGWLMVAETLVNPFGDDDDDFEVNWLIDRNLKVSYVIVDEMHEEHPELLKDQYWEEVVPRAIPYTEASKHYYTEPFLGSTKNIEVPLAQRNFVMVSMQNYAECSSNTITKGLEESAKYDPMYISRMHSLTHIPRNTMPIQKAGKSTSKSFFTFLKRTLYGSVADDSAEKYTSRTTLGKRACPSSDKTSSEGSWLKVVAEEFKNETAFNMSAYSIINERDPVQMKFEKPILKGHVFDDSINIVTLKPAQEFQTSEFSSSNNLNFTFSQSNLTQSPELGDDSLSQTISQEDEIKETGSVKRETIFQMSPLSSQTMPRMSAPEEKDMIQRALFEEAIAIIEKPLEGNDDKKPLAGSMKTSSNVKENESNEHFRDTQSWILKTAEEIHQQRIAEFTPSSSPLENIEDNHHNKETQMSNTPPSEKSLSLDDAKSPKAVVFMDDEGPLIEFEVLKEALLTEEGTEEVEEESEDDPGALKSQAIDIPGAKQQLAALDEEEKPPTVKLASAPPNPSLLSSISQKSKPSSAAGTIKPWVELKGSLKVFEVKGSINVGVLSKAPLDGNPLKEEPVAKPIVPKGVPEVHTFATIIEEPSEDVP